MEINKLQQRFSDKQWNLITFLCTEGKGNYSWYNLAVKFDIAVDKNTEQRKKAANDIWRRFLRIVGTDSDELQVVKQTLNGRGEVLFETRKNVPEEPEVSLEGYVIDKVTTNPYGGKWISYKKQGSNDINLEEVIDKLVYDRLQPLPEKGNTLEELTPNSLMAVINLYDAHLDKIPIKSTCGVESTVEENIEIFKRTFIHIVSELTNIDNVHKIVLPVGNDLYHTNGFNSTTKKGTPIEYYGSPEDNYYLVTSTIIWAIEYLYQHKPEKCSLDIIMVKSNHDEDKITLLGYWLNRLFQKQFDVTVNFERKQRKYLTFGENLLCFAHGDKEKNKIQQLPLIMATEMKQAWGTTTFRKMYLGDLHHGFEYQFLKAKDQPGVEVEFLRSVGTTDTWHEDFGWIGIPKTAYMQIFDYTDGEIMRRKYNIR